MMSRSLKLVGADRPWTAEPKALRLGGVSVSQQGAAASGAPTTSLPSPLVFRLGAYTMRRAAA